MALVAMKTRAEQMLAEQFEDSLGSLPASVGPQHLAARRAAMTAFNAAGLPHRRIEDWKYTDLRAGLKQAFVPPHADQAVTEAEVAGAIGPFAGMTPWRMVFVDGRFRADLSSGPDGHSGVTLKALGPIASEIEIGTLAEYAPTDALNRAFATDGVDLEIAAEHAAERPLLLVFLHSANEPQRVTTRNRIALGDGAAATIVELHARIGGAEVQTSCATAVAIGKGARLAHARVLLEGHGATHVCDWTARLDTKADYRAFQLKAGATLARTSLCVIFDGPEANADASGLLLGRGDDHIDATLVVDHAVPHCTSRELFKAVLDDGARGVFQGKIVVRPHAQKTDGKMMAQALMLSPDAEFNSKPELEIFADDVVCGHGSTVAELDDKLLFYCRSRGIPLAQAKALLIQSFVGEALDKVEDEAVRVALTQVADSWLAASR